MILSKSLLNLNDRLFLNSIEIKFMTKAWSKILKLLLFQISCHFEFLSTILNFFNKLSNSSSVLINRSHSIIRKLANSVKDFIIDKFPLVLRFRGLFVVQSSNPLTKVFLLSLSWTFVVWRWFRICTLFLNLFSSFYI